MKPLLIINNSRICKQQLLISHIEFNKGGLHGFSYFSVHKLTPVYLATECTSLSLHHDMLNKLKKFKNRSVMILRIRFILLSGNLLPLLSAEPNFVF